VHEHRVRVGHELDFRVSRQIAHADTLMQHQLADVDFDVLGDVTRQAFDLDLTMDVLEDAALLLHAGRFALGHDRHRDAQRLVHRDAIEVGVQNLVRDRVELVVLHEDARVARAREPQRDQRIRARFRVQDFPERLRLDGNRRGFGLSRSRDPVEDRRHLAAGARPVRFVLAARLSYRSFKYCFHNCPLPSALCSTRTARRPRSPRGCS
jgi:hypothetical protein